MKCHEIWRLELVYDKIESGNSKRKIVCIHFNCLTKKNEFGGRFPWLVSMAKLELKGRWWWARPDRESRGEEKGAPAGCGGVEGMQQGGPLVLALFRCCVLLLVCCVLCLVAVPGRRKQSRDKKKTRERKKRKKKLGKFPNLKFFVDKIKDNLRSWFQNYFCKRKE
jgi:hypothetical protein